MKNKWRKKLQKQTSMKIVITTQRNNYILQLEKEENNNRNNKRLITDNCARPCSKGCGTHTKRVCIYRYIYTSTYNNCKIHMSYIKRAWQ